MPWNDGSLLIFIAFLYNDCMIFKFHKLQQPNKKTVHLLNHIFGMTAHHKFA